MSASGESSPGARNGNSSNDDRFHRIPSESALNRKNGSTDPGVVPKVNKPWERSQSALDLQNNRTLRTSSTVDYSGSVHMSFCMKLNLIIAVLIYY